MILRITCWILKSAPIHLEYVILIALPLQQWYRERTSMSRYTCIACLVKRAAVRSVAVTVKL